MYKYRCRRVILLGLDIDVREIWRRMRIIIIVIIIILLLFIIITHTYEPLLLTNSRNSWRKRINDFDCVFCRLD